jgi:hypothetical protein
MKRIALAVLVIATTAFAQDKKAMPPASSPAPAAPAAAEPGTKMTCGQMMASKAALPSKMAELMTAVADSVEAHAKWTGTKDKMAKAEHDMLMKVAKDHRAVAKQYTAIAATMTKAKDLQQAPHDPKTADMAKMAELTQKQITLAREMAALMTKDADESEKMLASMKSGSAGSH